MSEKTMKLDFQCCGTCGHWKRKHATSRRFGYIIPNALCGCTFKYTLNFIGVPACFKKVETHYDDGRECPKYSKIDETVEVLVVEDS